MPFVYFIHERDNLDVFKIGKTENHPADRLDQLQTGNPRTLLVYRWLMVDNCSKTEEALHRKFKAQRIRGEWFKITADDIDLACATILSQEPGATCADQWAGYTAADRYAVKASKNIKSVITPKIL